MKKGLRVFFRVLRTLLIVFLVAVVLFTVAAALGLNRENGLFGLKMYIVLTDSMADHFKAGDVTVSLETDPSKLEAGDIITFASIDPANYGAVITHMIKAKTSVNGQAAFITYGTANNTNDATAVPIGNVLGKYAFHIPKAGYLIDTLKTTAGYLLIILLPFLLILILEGAQFLRLLKHYRTERGQESEETGDSPPLEDQEYNAMVQELEHLRQELKKRNNGLTDGTILPPSAYEPVEKTQTTQDGPVESVKATCEESAETVEENQEKPADKEKD